MLIYISTLLITLSSPIIFSHTCTQQEKPALVLYYTDYCPYSHKVLKYLRRIHKTVPMKDVGSSAADKKELLTIGGKLQVPCLVIDGKAMYESDDIIQWLAEHKDCLDPVYTARR
jgi:glutaredoxin